jgi:phage-related minor tail protein
MDKAVKLAFLLTATDSMSETLERAGQNLTGFQNKIAKIGTDASKMGGYFMTLGNQIGGGMMNIVRAATDYGDASIKTAQKVGMQVGEWQKLAYAAELAGVENEQLASGMVKFDRNLVEASKGSGTAVKAFKDLGINLKDTSGKLRAPQNILADVANIFSRVGDSAEKSALAQELFGKSGAQLIPLLNSGAKGLEAMGKEAETMGLVLSDGAAKSCEEFNDNLERVSKATLGLKIQIGTALAPILESLVNIITAVIKSITGFAKEYPILTKAIGGTVAVIGGLLFGIGAISLAAGAASYVILQFVKIWKIVTATIRGVQYAMIFLKAAIHGTRGATYAAMLTQRQFTIATKLHAAGIKIATAAQWLWNGAVTAGKAILTFFIGGVIFAGIKIGVLAVWQGISTAAQWLFNAALYACPIVWIIAGIMAVIAAVVLLVKYWDDVVAFFGRAWNGIKNIFSSIVEWFAGLWDGIKNIFTNAWNSIFGWLSGIHEKFVQFGKDIIQGLIKGITGAISKLWETIKNIGKGIGKFFSKILGINSPSMVFAKYGMNITQGLVVGIDRGEGAVERATGGLAMQAVSGYGQSLQILPAGSMSGGFGGAFNYSPTINIGAGVSESTKQDFSTMLRQHYRDIVDIMRRNSEDKTRISFF